MQRGLIGSRIRDLRVKHRMTQRDLASQSGISAPYLNLIEHNKRGIAGKKMIAIATALRVDVRELAEGLDQSLLDRVRAAAVTFPDVLDAETDSEEFVARYPDFARLIARLFDRDRETAENLQVLSDQLNNDPYFSEAIHLLLSSITTLRSTAEILAGPDDLPSALQGRFLGNLLEESKRLTRTAEGVLDHFETDRQEDRSEAVSLPLDTYLERRNYHLEELETGSVSDAVEIEFPLDDQIRAKRFYAQYAQMAKDVPLQECLAAIQKVGMHPMRLCAELNCDLPAILFRLAHLPASDEMPDFGLLECDSAGAVLYRKRISGFSLPRYGAACPLWPIYQSLSQPLQPISAFLDLPSGARVLTFSCAVTAHAGGFGQSPRLTSMMLFTSEYDEILNDALMPPPSSLSVGIQCQVCARKNCSARRVGSFLG